MFHKKKIESKQCNALFKSVNIFKNILKYLSFFFLVSFFPSLLLPRLLIRLLVQLLILRILLFLGERLFPWVPSIPLNDNMIKFVTVERYNLSVANCFSTQTFKFRFFLEWKIIKGLFCGRLLWIKLMKGSNHSFWWFYLEKSTFKQVNFDWYW